MPAATPDPADDRPLPPLTLVLGGARSGKSAHAEGLLQRLPPPRIYLATALVGDDPDMAARVRRHQARRGSDWHTVEAPHELPDALTAAAMSDRPVLLDSVTLWLANRLMAEASDPDGEGAALLAALDGAAAPIVCVSDEVGLSVVPESRLGRHFRDRLGNLNQALAAKADAVTFIAAGLPLTLKQPRD